MAFVLDCSVSMAWLFADEAHAGADALRDSLTEAPAVAPALWPAELANALLAATRRGRVAVEAWPKLRRQLEALPIEIDPVDLSAVLERVLPMANRYALTVYDATYLELATRRGLPLATLDRKLAEAGRAAGVTLCL